MFNVHILSQCFTSYLKVKELVRKSIRDALKECKWSQCQGADLDIKNEIKSYHGLLRLDRLDLQTFILF